MTAFVDHAVTCAIRCQRHAPLAILGESHVPAPTPPLPRKRGRERTARAPRDSLSTPHAGIGNTGFAEANAAGKITWMSLPWICVFTGAAPWFCPLTNLVGP